MQLSICCCGRLGEIKSTPSRKPLRFSLPRTAVSLCRPFLIGPSMYQSLSVSSCRRIRVAHCLDVERGDGLGNVRLCKGQVRCCSPKETDTCNETKHITHAMLKTRQCTQRAYVTQKSWHPYSSQVSSRSESIRGGRLGSFAGAH